MIHSLQKKLTTTLKTYKEIQYIITAEFQQQRIANYCGPDKKILKDIETSHITDTKTHSYPPCITETMLFEV